MDCLACRSGKMSESFEPYFAKLKSGYLIIENVPCWKCAQCGEVLFSMDVIEKIEKIVASYNKVESKIFIVDYQKAA